ncbi:MAG: tetratricopeptide repeat protein [Bacteroidetes bacterium]|nr:tetratricopeptide repeat protein [Bacteroidota bacterium]MBU1580242.1 tetratricopeptide repeat protein [Bacteroidota bacterium]MBU2557686.1 tetratricopeptide repeat protein [Bacteroidota bacterium]
MMKPQWLYLFFFLSFLLSSPFQLASQPYVSDSLISRLAMLDNSIEKVNTLNELALYFKESDPDKALYYSKQALSMANQIESLEACALSNKVMGQLFEFQHNYQPTINYYLISIKHYQKLGNDKELASLYNKLGWIYITNHYDYDQGLKYFSMALEHAKKSESSGETATALNSIGGIFYYQQDYTTALHYFNESLKIRQEKGFPKDIAASLNNVGEIYRLQGDFDKALDYYNRAVEINQSNGFSTNLAINLSNIGLIYSFQNQADKARTYFMKSIKINEEINNMAGKLSALYELGQHYNRLADYDNAILAFNDMDALAHRLNDLQGLQNASEGLAIAYENKNNIIAALLHFKQYTKFKDSLFVINKAEQLDEMQTRFTLDLKEKEIALKDNKIALLQREQKLNNFRQWLLLLSLLLVLFVGVLFYGKLQSRNKKSRLLLEQKESLNKAREALMQSEIKNKSNELTNFALHLGEKTKFLEELKKELKDLRQIDEGERESRIKELVFNVQQNLQIQKELDEFQKTVQNASQGFAKKLKASFPNLTKNEERLCAMLKLNLSSKEIAALNNSTTRAVEMGRYRLRKKLQLDQDQNIVDFLQEF